MFFSAFFAELIFFGCPAASLIYFIVSLVRFINKRILKKRFPHLVLDDALISSRRHLIISSIILGILIIVSVGLSILLLNAIAYM